VGLFLTMTGFERETLLGHLAGLIVNVSASLILIPSYGAQGAAYAAAAGLLTWNTVLAFKVYRRLQLRPGIF
ncbi:polysaccharide biosynthesis C-terminal domain-containing protein, partial [Haloferax sp. KTX1]|uniref:polysaccharide biosynthesis C-terminal domain-containing protein n=1 Tax=Haloferax sp. KTX1 TaxID=2600597 RepID=UPI0016525C45